MLPMASQAVSMNAQQPKNLHPKIAFVNQPIAVSLWPVQQFCNWATGGKLIEMWAVADRSRATFCRYLLKAACIRFRPRLPQCEDLTIRVIRISCHIVSQPLHNSHMFIHVEILIEALQSQENFEHRVTSSNSALVC